MYVFVAYYGHLKACDKINLKLADKRSRTEEMLMAVYVTCSDSIVGKI